MSGDLRLTTARLALSPMRESDFPDLCALYGDPAFAIPLFPQALTPEEVWTRLLRDIGHWAVMGCGHWAVRRSEDGAFVGGVGVLNYHRQIDPPLDVPELGWGVGVRFQGQGLAREACEAVLAWCEDVLRTPETVCIIAPANRPSIRLALALGYRLEDQRVYREAPIQVFRRNLKTRAPAVVGPR